MSSGSKMAFIVTRFVRMSEVLITHYSKSSYKKLIYRALVLKYHGPKLIFVYRIYYVTCSMFELQFGNLSLYLIPWQTVFTKIIPGKCRA